MRSREAVTVPVTPARSRPGTTARDGAAGGVRWGSPRLHLRLGRYGVSPSPSGYLASEHTT